MSSLTKALSPITVNLEDLLLDPNNPRFAEFGGDYDEIQETRFADKRVQDNAIKKMRSPIFSVSELRDTIKTIGFLPMDRIVVRKWKNNQDKIKYIVIEGNRRVTALKWLIDLEKDGKEEFNKETIKNFTNIECLLLDRSNTNAVATLILPGLRHVSGIKEWGAYQKAKAVSALRKTGLSPQEAAQSLGLSTIAANKAYRCFLALENMKEDEEFGEFAQPNMYSYFEEIFKKPHVKNWLSWSDDKGLFEEANKLREFYSWMVPPVGDDTGPHKLPMAISVRELAQIIDDESALGVFRSHDGTLVHALARYKVDHPQDWYPTITAAVQALKSLTPDMLRNMNDEVLKCLQDLEKQIVQSLEDKRKLSDKAL